MVVLILHACSFQDLRMQEINRHSVELGVAVDCGYRFMRTFYLLRVPKTVTAYLSILVNALKTPPSYSAIIPFPRQSAEIMKPEELFASPVCLPYE